jgi:hypothetical protein
LDKAFALANAVKQMIKRLAMLGAKKKEARIWRNIKRRLAQPVIFQIHNMFLTQSTSSWEEKALSENLYRIRNTHSTSAPRQTTLCVQHLGNRLE